MRKTLMRQVTNSIFEVMETMFYLTMEESAETIAEFVGRLEETSLKACSISFSGSFSGTIFLIVPRDILALMTMNFMGVEKDDISDAYMDGTLKEALNMVSGNTLTRIDQQSYMGLGIPVLVDPDSIPPGTESAVFQTAEGPMAALVDTVP